MLVYQINLSPSMGGAEIFTGFFCKAFESLSRKTVLITSSRASYWQKAGLASDQLICISSDGDLLSTLPENAVAIIHSPIPEATLRQLKDRNTLIAIAHQATYGDKVPSYYRYADIIIPVSNYVISTLQASGFRNIYPNPLYGIGNVAPVPDNTVTMGPLIDWDRRKLRDRILAALPDTRHLVCAPSFSKRDGLTLGIVSRIAEAKQFPTLFSSIAEQIRIRPKVWIEVFGMAVGYRALRDFRRAIRPIQDRVRFWGMQDQVAKAYANIDFLVTGLPERESLGLNVIEAQFCHTPVLAPNAPPFTETVIDGVSGFLYADPRLDNGADFGRVLDQIIRSDAPVDLSSARDHLEKFTFPAFCERIHHLLLSLPSTSDQQTGQ